VIVADKNKALADKEKAHAAEIAKEDALIKKLPAQRNKDKCIYS